MQDDEDFDMGEAAKEQSSSEDSDDSGSEGGDESDEEEYDDDEEGGGGSSSSKKRKRKKDKENKSSSSKKGKKASGSGGAGAKKGGAKKGATKMPKKDPNAPKRPMSSFMLFSNKYRHEIKQSHPNTSFGEIGKLLGEKWRAVTSEEKAEMDKLSCKVEGSFFIIFFLERFGVVFFFADF